MQSAATPTSTPTPASSRADSVRLELDVRVRKDRWVLSDENLPEATQHRDATDLLKLILLAFTARKRLDALVAANLACRWDRDNPAFGVDPDIALIEPAPPGASALPSLRTWLEGHVPPRFAVEVVSATNPHKDYEAAPAKYAALGTRELVIFDPERFGPKGADGPHVLQVWRRREDRTAMSRAYAGDGPAYSTELNAWLICAGKGMLRIADDEQGRSLWQTEAEAAAEARCEAEDTLRRMLEDFCELCGVPLDSAKRAHIASLDAAGLDRLRSHIKAQRAWPD